MPQFVYKAKKTPQDVIEGSIFADSKSAAIQKIAKMGYYLLSVEEYLKSAETQRGKNLFFKKKIGTKDVANMTRQLSDLLEGGLTIAKALDILHTQTHNVGLKDIVRDIHDFCLAGNALSAALAKHPDVFSNLYVSMVKSGESGGTLESILQRLADYYESQLDIQTKLRSALAYPLLMMTVGFLTVMVLLTVVIPKMLKMFGDMGQALPWPTRILIQTTDFLKTFWWVILAGVFFLAISFMRWKKTPKGKSALDQFQLKLPGVGPLIKKIEIARLARTLATLLHNGVGLLESLDIASHVVSNTVIRQEVTEAALSVKEGSGIAGGFRKSKIIPPLVVNMIAVGEESSKVEKSLFKIAETYERESDSAIKIMLSLLEPVLILALGAMVGFIVIAMFLPIFEINFLAS